MPFYWISNPKHCSMFTSHMLHCQLGFTYLTSSKLRRSVGLYVRIGNTCEMVRIYRSFRLSFDCEKWFKIFTMLNVRR